MPRQLELRATFAGWKLPNNTILPGPFEIILEGARIGRWSWRYRVLLATPAQVQMMISSAAAAYPGVPNLSAPSRLPFHDSDGKPLSFAESKLEEGKAQIAKMFEKQLTDWK